MYEVDRARRRRRHVTSVTAYNTRICILHLSATRHLCTQEDTLTITSAASLLLIESFYRMQQKSSRTWRALVLRDKIWTVGLSYISARCALCMLARRPAGR